jgi:hypothetical protein
MDSNNPSTVSSTDHLAAKLSALIQQDITVYCPGHNHSGTYTARVLEVDHTRLKISLPRCIAGNGYLRQTAPVIANFIIGNTLYEARARYCADDRRIRELVIEGDIAPTSRRRYDRTSLEIQCGVVPVSNLRLSRGQFAGLTWKKCRTLDISAGGALLQIPFQSRTKAHFLLNLDVPGFDGPLFIFAQVQWGNICDFDRTQFLCGLSFVVREDLGKHFSNGAVTELPGLMLTFDKKKQKELDVFLKERDQVSKQGDRNDRQQDER